MKRLTRKRFGTISLGLMACATLGSAPIALAADGPVKVRLGTLVPRGSSYFQHLQAMGEKWRQAPGGGAALTIYPDGTMGGEADMVRRMRAGQLQAGMLTAVGLAEIEPAVYGLQNIPMLFRSLEEVDHVGEKLQPILEKRLLQKGFVVLFWADAGWVRFFSKDRIVYPDDLKKMKLWTWAGSSDQVQIYKASGFNPVPLETADILPSLQTGLVNATPAPPYIAMASQIDGPAPHMLELNWGPLVGATLVTRKTWDAIPAASRDQMLKAAKEAGRKIIADSRRESVESVEAMVKRGLQVQKVTPEVEAAWRKAAEAVYSQIRGHLVPDDVFDEVVKLVKEYRAAEGAAK